MVCTRIFAQTCSTHFFSWFCFLICCVLSKFVFDCAFAKEIPFAISNTKMTIPKLSCS